MPIINLDADYTELQDAAQRAAIAIIKLRDHLVDCKLPNKTQAWKAVNKLSGQLGNIRREYKF